MKTYTAIYSTEKIKDIKYSFEAENIEEAKEFTENKFSVKNVKLIEEIERNQAVTEDLIREYFEQEYGNVPDFYIEKTTDNVLTAFGYDPDFGCDTRLDELRFK